MPVPRTSVPDAVRQDMLPRTPSPNMPSVYVT